MNTTQEPDYDIFVSYSRIDKNGRKTESSYLGDKIIDYLCNRNHLPFSRKELTGIISSEQNAIVSHALDNAKLLIILITNSEDAKLEPMKSEWKYFQKTNKPVIPVYKNMGQNDRNELPYEIFHLEGFDLTDDHDGKELDELLKCIDRIFNNMSIKTAVHSGNGNHRIAEKKENYSIKRQQSQSRNIIPFQYHGQANSNDSDSVYLYHLALNNFFGNGVKQDVPLACRQLVEAAEAENAEAMLFLGMIYHNGQEVSQDYSKAFDWYKKAASLGNAKAMCNLGVLFEEGKGVWKSPSSAMYWYNKAVNADDPTAMLNLGLMLIKGEGKKKDYNRAIELLSKSAQLGNATAGEILSEAGISYEDTSSTRVEENTDEDIIVSLTDENGEEVRFEFLDLIEYRNNTYAVLLQVLNDGEKDDTPVILQVKSDDYSDEETYLSVDDKRVLNAVFEIFKERNKDEFNFV